MLLSNSNVLKKIFTQNSKLLELLMHTMVTVVYVSLPTYKYKISLKYYLFVFSHSSWWLTDISYFSIEDTRSVKKVPDFFFMGITYKILTYHPPNILLFGFILFSTAFPHLEAVLKSHFWNRIYKITPLANFI